MVSSMLSTNSRCVKYLLFIFNLLFVISGIILLSIGAVIHGLYYKYDHFLDNKFLSVPSLLIAVGTIIFFIAFFGCCGALRENYCMIVTFTALLVLVFIMEFSAGISGYVLRSRAEEVITDKMSKSMLEYNSSSEIRGAWDFLQTQMGCCGTNNYSDWDNHYEKDKLPPSCCPNMDPAEDNCTMAAYPFKSGCYPMLVKDIKSHAMQLGGVGLGIAFVQALGIWFSVYLARAIRNSYESV